MRSLVCSGFGSVFCEERRQLKMGMLQSDPYHPAAFRTVLSTCKYQAKPTTTANPPTCTARRLRIRARTSTLLGFPRASSARSSASQSAQWVVRVAHQCSAAKDGSRVSVVVVLRGQGMRCGACRG